MRKITPRQTQYLAILMTKHLGNLRKYALRAYYGVDSTKDLTFDQAHQAIERLVPENVDQNFVAELQERAQELLGQKKLL